MSVSLQSIKRVRFQILLLMLFILFVVVAVFDAFIVAGGILYIVRLGMILCAWTMYSALKG